jgi:hypothetical protein
MSQQATHIGELAFQMLARGGQGEVSRVFERSAYLKKRSDFLLVLWSGLKSPMTVNVKQTKNGAGYLRVGEHCNLSRAGIRFTDSSIEVGEAEVYRSSLLRRRALKYPSAEELVRGIAMLRPLYDVSKGGTLLYSDSSLVAFARRTLAPLAAGDFEAAYDANSYLPLIGRGGGFTPAGDDFVGGFLAAFNYAARCRGSRQISIPPSLVRARTIPESAAILGNAAKGYVDEALERLVLEVLGGSNAGFANPLLEVARRGHTSGIDMSLGVLLCDAALLDNEIGQGALQECLDVLWRK